MSKLEDFLGLRDVSDITETIKEVIDGKELELVVRPITEAEHSDFQKRAVNVSNKNQVSFNKGRYNELVLSACIVEPNFGDAEFLAKMKCQTKTEFFNRKFPAGVVEDISEKIQKLSGFETMEMEIESAKN